LFKSSNLVHSTTDSQKSSQRHEIQTTTENSCAQWARRLTSKLTKKPLAAGVLGSYFYYKLSSTGVRV
jgi:hypothetical protein